MKPAATAALWESLGSSSQFIPNEPRCPRARASSPLIGLPAASRAQACSVSARGSRTRSFLRPRNARCSQYQVREPVLAPLDHLALPSPAHPTLQEILLWLHLLASNRR